MISIGVPERHLERQDIQRGIPSSDIKPPEPTVNLYLQDPGLA